MIAQSVSFGGRDCAACEWHAQRMAPGERWRCPCCDAELRRDGKRERPKESLDKLSLELLREMEFLARWRPAWAVKAFAPTKHRVQANAARTGRQNWIDEHHDDLWLAQCLQARVEHLAESPANERPVAVLEWIITRAGSELSAGQTKVDVRMTRRIGEAFADVATRVKWSKNLEAAKIGTDRHGTALLRWATALWFGIPHEISVAP